LSALAETIIFQEDKIVNDEDENEDICEGGQQKLCRHF
jgi:hypothetical protein